MNVFRIGRPFESDPARIRQFWSGSFFGKGPVVYVCDREMRISMNHGLFFAAELANDRGVPLVVAGISDTSWSYGNYRHLTSEAGCFAEIEESLARRGVPFFSFFGDAAFSEFEAFATAGGFSSFVFDFSPLLPHLALRKRIAEHSGVPVFEADSRCLVPARNVTDKSEIGARTFRPKFWKNFILPDPFQADFPTVSADFSGTVPLSVRDCLRNAVCDRSVDPVGPFVSGEKEAKRLLSEFVEHRIVGYADSRNDPNSPVASGLSAYFRNGNLAPEEVFLCVKRSSASEEDQDAFLEEFCVRRELSENFCLHNAQYASFAWAPNWAVETLSKHSGDVREYRYCESEFERGETHDDLWNAAQNELLTTGKIASYLRMYWAKKILEWSESPKEAHRIALRLNDRYALDGRSPNGYVGVLWAIAGLHDRPWFDRETYGAIRYMNRNGCERKFDVKTYVGKWKKTQNPPVDE